jgi:hypothetical protein
MPTTCSAWQHTALPTIGAYVRLVVPSHTGRSCVSLVCKTLLQVSWHDAIHCDHCFASHVSVC